MFLGGIYGVPEWTKSNDAIPYLETRGVSYPLPFTSIFIQFKHKTIVSPVSCHGNVSGDY